MARNISPTGIVGLMPNSEEAGNLIRKAVMLLANAGISIARRLTV